MIAGETVCIPRCNRVRCNLSDEFRRQIDPHRVEREIVIGTQARTIVVICCRKSHTLAPSSDRQRVSELNRVSVDNVDCRED